jgi:molybdate transport system substrate-binding protein
VLAYQCTAILLWMEACRADARKFSSSLQCCCDSPVPPRCAQTPLRVAAAADLEPVLPPILAQFQQATGIHAEATYQASAMLTTQIQNGAPFDLFLSADLGYPKRLIDAGLADAAGSPIPPRRSPTPGTLVLWTRKDSHLPPPSLDLLRNPALKRLAIANPDRAPYGRAAVAALTSLKLYDTLKPRLVTAENIAQAAQFVDSGNADAGLISLTSALTPRLSARRLLLRDPARSLSAHRAGRGHRQQHQAARRRAQAARLPALAPIQAQLAKSGLTPVK